jgi:hypothetical protein
LGSQDISSPLAFAEGLFLFFLIIFQKKKDLGKICCRYIKNGLEK